MMKPLNITDRNLGARKEILLNQKNNARLNKLYLNTVTNSSDSGRIKLIGSRSSPLALLQTEPTSSVKSNGSTAAIKHSPIAVSTIKKPSVWINLFNFEICASRDIEPKIKNAPIAPDNVPIVLVTISVIEEVLSMVNSCRTSTRLLSNVPVSVTTTVRMIWFFPHLLLYIVMTPNSPNGINKMMF